VKAAGLVSTGGKLHSGDTDDKQTYPSSINECLVAIVIEDGRGFRDACGKAELRDALKKDPSVGFCL